MVYLDPTRNEKNTASIVRSVIFLIALINQGLAIFGKSMIPLDEKNLEIFISFLISGVTSLWVWWKNNYISSKGKAQKKILKMNELE